jgi:hypothetical protein
VLKYKTCARPGCGVQFELRIKPLRSVRRIGLNPVGVTVCSKTCLGEAVGYVQVGQQERERVNIAPVDNDLGHSTEKGERRCANAACQTPLAPGSLLAMCRVCRIEKMVKNKLRHRAARQRRFVRTVAAIAAFGDIRDVEF